MKVWVPAIGPVGARRALAGLDPGGETARRAARLASRVARDSRSGRQPAAACGCGRRAPRRFPAVLGIAILIVALALIPSRSAGRQRPRGACNAPPIWPRSRRRDRCGTTSIASSYRRGCPAALSNPAHLERAEYLYRARVAATTAAERNDLDGDLVEVGFPDRRSFAPLQVRVEIGGEIRVGGADGRPAGPDPATSADAKAEVTLASATGAGQPAMAEGGGYAGPLAYRQGEPMRPDVASRLRPHGRGGRAAPECRW